MTAEARVTSVWKKQKLFVAAFLTAFGLWFFWDGLVGWPRKNERYLRFKEFEQAGDLDGWRDYAKSRGWKQEAPHRLYTRQDLIGQYVFGSIGILLGLSVFVYWLTQKGGSFRMDEAGVHTPKGVHVPFDAITGLGLKKWESKGYATVRYQLAGRSSEFLLDDYKYDRDPTHAIVKEIEHRLTLRAAPATRPDSLSPDGPPPA